MIKMEQRGGGEREVDEGVIERASIQRRSKIQSAPQKKQTPITKL